MRSPLFHLLALLLLMTGLLASPAKGAKRVSDYEQSWLNCLVPLPKEASLEGAARVKASEIGLKWEAEDTPEATTAREMLLRFARAGEGGVEFAIHVLPAGKASGEIDAAALARLRSLPNAGQAYMIRPTKDKRGLILAAITPLGLLYAANTLTQLVRATDRVKPDDPVEIPLTTITDWPDIAERGQWGGDTGRHLGQFSALKLNVLESAAGLGIDSQGKPSAGISPSLISKARALGVKIVPYLPHLEQISRSAGVSRRTDIVSKPDPSKPVPSDYTPGLCMSSPATCGLVRDWLSAVASMPGVNDITVWLSEDRAPCFCEKCVGKEPYEIEVHAIVGAFQQVRQKHPSLRLRLLTTQGSYPVNDKVLLAAPSDVGIIYYDGSRTYDSSKKPMIYPLLDDAAKSGRWIGVYPQITHSWRTVFPWTAPRFIKYRADEFASKKLSNVIGYAVPSNYHHAFNVAAMAEWTWNANGRTPEEFARAYALRTGLDPELFPQWAMLAGEAGWALADSRLMLVDIYSPTFPLNGKAAFDQRFGPAVISSESELKKALSQARDALAIAQQSNDADMVCESECALAGLQAFEALKTASSLIGTKTLSEAERKSLSDCLDAIDRSALTLRSRLIEWGERVRARSGDRTVPGRLCDTAYAMLRTCDALRAKAVELAIPDPCPDSRLRELRKWSADDFTAPNATISIDISDRVFAAGGHYQIGFDFIDSAYGTDIRAVSITDGPDASSKTLATSPDPACRVSIHERWHEMRIDIPAREANSPLLLKIDLSGPPSDAPADRRTCSGSIRLRHLD